MANVLEINNLHKSYGRTLAVNDLSLTVSRGNVYGLLGPNGSGKSTTLGIILNVVNATKGTWRWFGETPHPEHLKKIGAIIESPKFYPYLTAYQNLEIVATIKEAPLSNIEPILKKVGLYERRLDKFMGFSLGMKQRLAIGAALVNNPEILILDEPTNGLDPQGIHQVREIIQDIAATGTTIILASHLLDEVEKICSHVVVLKNGKTLYNGPVDTMSNENGYFEINAQDLDILKAVLEESNWHGRIVEEKNHIQWFVTQPVQPEDLNQYLFKRGITLSHLVLKKASLEEQFINLTSK